MEVEKKGFFVILPLLLRVLFTSSAQHEERALKRNGRLLGRVLSKPVQSNRLVVRPTRPDTVKPMRPSATSRDPVVSKNAH